MACEWCVKCQPYISTGKLKCSCFLSLPSEGGCLCEALTVPVRATSPHLSPGPPPQVAERKVGDLQHKPAVHHTVGRGQVTVGTHGAAVQVVHSL